MTYNEEQEQKHQLWKERISEYESSGLSIPAWCKEQQIPAHQMRYWLRKFEEPNKSALKSKKTSRWVELDTHKLSGSGVSLRVGSVVLDIQQGFDRQLLVEVVQVLTSIC
ncbi:MAG: IS66 family insertion sequence element accessory protein TnpB [Firmicutes bacterium]|nr:IS66 family insertion sequence element accessory protein TnpB [Bacillota bacterium]